MKHLILIAAGLAFLICGCAANPRYNSSLKAIYPEIDLRLTRNMTPDEVVQMLGSPDRPVMIYFYFDEQKEGVFARLSKNNYTPLVFVDNKLAGWGWQYLNLAAKNMITD